jgi:hypothetical protein
MAQASSNNSTRTPVDRTRRRFLAVAAVGSIAPAALRLQRWQDVPQAVTVPRASPALRDAICALDHAHAGLLAAKTDNDAANDLFEAWERSHPQPRSKRGTRKWIKKARA